MSANRARGTRDFLPETMLERLAVLDTLANTFQRFGFEPLDTPAFERIETLTGKYGEEGDQLIFKILARGEGGREGTVDLALRYDLTVPLARVVAMNPGLRMPFMRYHMGPVWRADRPARGRFREFWQCDGDILGSESTLAEAQCLTFAWTALDALGFGDVVLRLNDRRLLRALAVHLGVPDRESELLITIDKLDKIGRDGVDRELTKRGFEPSVIEGLWTVLAGDDDPLERMERVLAGREGTAEAVVALREVIARATAMGCPAAQLQIDPTLARGLDYYTGPIWEGVLPGENMGTICSGGRYDGLVAALGGPAVPAVGISIGVERVLVLREERGTQSASRTSAPVLVTIYDSETEAQSIAIARRFREAGIGTELYVDARKLAAQFKYANARGHRWIVVIGPSERDSGTLNLKELATGQQQVIAPEAAIAYLQEQLAR